MGELPAARLASPGTSTEQFTVYNKNLGPSSLYFRPSTDDCSLFFWGG